MIWVLVWAAASASSVPDVGHEDGSYAGAGAEPTGSKPQSKLWFNDGLWWADMFEPTSKTWHIFKLNRSTQKWADTGTTLDSRVDTRADTLWDGKHLYVASNVVAAGSASSASGSPAKLFRYSYTAAKNSYKLDAGYPVDINNVSSESLSIDRDSKGVLWATWTQGQKVYVNSTSGGDSQWGTPYALPVSGATNLSSDDISAISAYGSKIGVLWSNQATQTFYFASHTDGGGPSSWSGSAVSSGLNSADDHVAIRQVQGDKAGRLFAAVKTSADLGSDTSAGQIQLLVRDPGTGEWTATTFGTVGDCHTRPVVMIDATHQVLHMFATAPSSGVSGCPHTGTPGTIYEKTTPLSKIAFAPGRGTPVLEDSAAASMNDVTSTKQTITSATGLVILASNTGTQRYWHADLPVAGAAASRPAVRPAVTFTATRASAKAFRTIRFRSASRGPVVRWTWNFGDRKSAKGRTASHTYVKPGRYRVVLTGWTAKGVRVTSTRTVVVARPR